MQETLQRSSLNLDIGCESFMDLHFAGNFTCLAELLHILILVLGVTSVGASLLRLQVNWAETKIQCIGDTDLIPQVDHVGSSQVEVVSSECAPLAMALVSPRYLEALSLPGMYDIAGEAHMEGTCLGQLKGPAVLSCVLLGIMHGFEAWTVAKSGAR